MEKNVVVFMDGTWNNAVSSNPPFTNIYALYTSCSPNEQVKIYTPGVGAHVGWAAKYIFGVTGKGVFQAARWAWLQINENRTRDDKIKIFIFGFSRGAFAARHLAGMLVRMGLDGWRGGAEKMFHEYLKALDSPEPQAARQEVHFLGLFDCVPGNRIYMLRDRNRPLLDKRLERGIRHFRHAVSTEERRWSFRPLIFHQNGQESFSQHWFPGFHSDVGGGNHDENGLAEFSFWWMIREAIGCGLSFNNIVCPKHAHGNALNVIQGVDPEAKSMCSDYLTTKLGFRWDRKSHEIDPEPGPRLSFSEMDICLACDNEMFDYLSTIPGRRKMEAKGFRAEGGEWKYRPNSA